MAPAEGFEPPLPPRVRAGTPTDRAKGVVGGRGFEPLTSRARAARLGPGWAIPRMAPSRGLEPRWSRLTAGCLPIRPRGCGSRGPDSNRRSPGCEPGALAAELLGNGAGGRFRAADAHAFNVPLYLLSYSSELDPTPGIEPGPGGSADRRLPTWPGRDWHQGKDLNPHLVVQGHGSYRLDDPGVAPSTGIEPATFCSTGRCPPPGDHEGATNKDEAWWWCAGEELHLHSRWPRGYGPLGSLMPEPTRCHHAWFGLPLPIRFSRC